MLKYSSFCVKLFTYSTGKCLSHYRILMLTICKYFVLIRPLNIENATSDLYNHLSLHHNIDHIDSRASDGVKLPMTWGQSHQYFKSNEHPYVTQVMLKGYFSSKYCEFGLRMQ